ncbi:ATP-binding protein [Halomarina halobia]|uniref:ATP-binding protein n=1 Tax=Halomarina halobia TaxID=3033386 RepID=A0ABD6AAM0_9EURY|nr:DUF87 domain-containing protein [Halomarina sp. PSR21]
MSIIGRTAGAGGVGSDGDGSDEGRRDAGGTDENGPVGHLGAYRARDESAGARVTVDLGGPHAALVVGKRGSGKSYTLGVLAEELDRVEGIAPVIVDPMGAFGTLAAEPVGARVVRPRVRADALEPRAWCDLLGLDPEGAAGALVWRAAAAATTLDGMRAFVAEADAPGATRRAASNHLDLAAAWDVFGGELPPLSDGRTTVLDCSGVDRAPMNAVCRAAANRCYRARLAGGTDRLPWLLVDEAHALFGGLAAPALRRLLTRGRQPGVSLVAATQRPAALPAVAVSQADLVVMHRLSSRDDREAMRAARPASMRETFDERMPTRPGEALVVDDATERVHTVQVRERATPHGGESPRLSGQSGLSAGGG